MSSRLTRAGVLLAAATLASLVVFAPDDSHPTPNSTSGSPSFLATPDAPQPSPSDLAPADPRTRAPTQEPRSDDPPPPPPATVLHTDTQRYHIHAPPGAPPPLAAQLPDRPTRAQLPPGRYRIHVEADGFVSSEPRWLSVPPSGEVDLPDVQLDRAAVLRGRVEADVPAAAVALDVEWTRADGSASWRRTYEGEVEGGGFELEGVPEGRYRVRALARAGEVRWSSGWVEVALDEAEAPVETLTLDPHPPSATGRVVGYDGQPIPEAQIRVGTESLTTDALGGFAVYGVYGLNRLDVEAEGFEPTSVTATLRDDRPPFLDVALRSAAAIVGQAAPGVRVSLSLAESPVARRAVADTEGRFQFEGLRPGYYRVRADDGVERWVTLEPGARAQVELR